MNEGRQREPRAVASTRAASVSLGVFATLMLGAACTGTTPLPDATRAADAVGVASTVMASAPTLAAAGQTGVSGARTAVSDAQSAVGAVQTLLPGAQATVAAGATTVSGVLGDPRVVPGVVGVILGGASVEVRTDPPAGGGEAVRQVTLTATDVHGTFGRLDPSGQRDSATTALVAASQFFPAAELSLQVVDTSGKPLVHGTKLPGADAQVSQ